MKKIILLFMCMMLVSNMFIGCTDSSEFDGTVSSEAQKEETDEKQASNQTFPKKLDFKKINTVKLDTYHSINVADGGIIYRNPDGKYGLMTFDGKSKTEAKYDVCKMEGNFFCVVESGNTDGKSGIDAMNCVGVVNANGRTIVPQKYASVKAINHRYIQVCEVTHEAASRDEALVFQTDRNFAVFAEDGDTFFAGNWYVYDAQTGEPVNGVSGTKPVSVTAYGDIINYKSDSGENLYVNSKGEALPEDAHVVDNGTYYIEKSGNGTLYNADGSTVFTYSTNEFLLTNHVGVKDGYIGKAVTDGITDYLLIDKNGKVSSSKLPSILNTYGNFAHLKNGKLCDFKGNIVYDEYAERITDDNGVGYGFIVEDADKNFTLLSYGGKVLYSQEDDIISADKTYCMLKKEADDKQMIYCINDNDFTIDGTPFSPWLAKISYPEGGADIVDIISGETVIAGYDSYHASYGEGREYYVYASNCKNDITTIDIYKLK